VFLFEGAKGRSFDCIRKPWPGGVKRNGKYWSSKHSSSVLLFLFQRRPFSFGYYLSFYLFDLTVILFSSWFLCPLCSPSPTPYASLLLVVGVAAWLRLAGGGGGEGDSEESRAAGAGGGAQEERGGAPAQRGLPATEKQTGDQNAPLQSGQPLHVVCRLYLTKIM